MKLPFFNIILSRIEEGFCRSKLFLFIFSKKRVHRYFLILLVLMLLAGTAFFIVEAEHIFKTTEIIDDHGIFSRILAIIYWSIVTISTTGYGDVIASTNAGTILAAILLFLSIVTVSLFTANLTSALTNKKLLESRGIMEIAKLKNHFVICGWKYRMGRFLEEVVINNPGIPPKKTTDLSLLVSNLKSAKSIENNRPHILPADDYIIPPNPLAIVIEKNNLSGQISNGEFA